MPIILGRRVGGGFTERGHIDGTKSSCIAFLGLFKENLVSLLVDISPDSSFLTSLLYSALSPTVSARVARIATEKTGVEIVHIFPESMPAGENTFFCSVFDAKNMTDYQKMEEIKKRVNALVFAYKMWNEGMKRLYKRKKRTHR